uniref:EF-hand domain-containing protein n=1 Tax=Oryza glumipatula TaxID=40148 RepID=A0A0E0B6F2_9ORYZ
MIRTLNPMDTDGSGSIDFHEFLGLIACAKLKDKY